jgi:malonyl-CoA O-methyltransferase
MNDVNDFHIDKRRVRHAFNRAAAAYDRAAILQREVGTRLLERLEYIRLQPQTIADIGAGTGHLSKALAQRYKRAKVIALDLAPNMLGAARRHTPVLARLLNRQSFVCGDAERLPFAARSTDLVFSNLTLQWCSNLEAVFAEFRRILKPGGLLIFSTFGPDTLKELRESWATVDEAVHVNVFIDMHDIGDALLRNGFADPVMDAERFTLTYPNVHAVMNELKTLGAHNATSGRPRTLTGKGRLHAVTAAYERYRDQGALPATFEVVYGLAWQPSVAMMSTREAGVVKIPITALQRRTPGGKS